MPGLQLRRRVPSRSTGPAPFAGIAPVVSQRDLDSAAMARSTLAVSLEAAVPLWILKWRRARPEHRIARAQACAAVVAAHGDAILYRSKPHAPRWHAAHGKPGDEDYQPAVKIDGAPGSAEAFNHLAEGIAIAAFQPGGITAFGHHWEVGDAPTAA